MPFLLALKLQRLPPPFHFWLLRKLNYPVAITYCNFLRIHMSKTSEMKARVVQIILNLFSACKKEYILMRHLYQLYWETWYIYLLQMKLHKGTALRLITTKGWPLKPTKPSSVKKSDQNLWLLLTEKSARGKNLVTTQSKKTHEFRKDITSNKNNPLPLQVLQVSPLLQRFCGSCLSIEFLRHGTFAGCESNDYGSPILPDILYRYLWHNSITKCKTPSKKSEAWWAPPMPKKGVFIALWLLISLQKALWTSV